MAIGTVEPNREVLGVNENAKNETLKMFSGRREVPHPQREADPGRGGLGMWVLREVTELLAPVFWLTSLTKLILVAKHVFMFIVGSASFYYLFHWLLTGVPASWWLVLQVPFALFGLMLALSVIMK